MAGPAFDAVSYSGLSVLSASWPHTPVGTPKGFTLLIVGNATASDSVTNVTYGGVTVPRVGAVSHVTGAEDAYLYIYHLGIGVPTGAQTVAVTTTHTDWSALAYTQTASANTTVDVTATLDSGGTADPSVTLNTTTDTFICAVLHSGQNSTGGHAPDAAYTEDQPEDYGSQTASFVHRTTNPAAGAIAVSWTATSEEAGIVAVAIKDLATTKSLPVFHRSFRVWRKY